MIRNLLSVLLPFAILPLGLQAQAICKYPFQNPQLPVEQRITDLLSRMTPEEKIFCFGIDPSVPRLGVRGSGHIEGLSYTTFAYSHLKLDAQTISTGKPFTSA